jgi:hypothetical protein
MKIPLVVLRTVESRSELSGHPLKAGEAILVVRGIPRWLVLGCPDGCGETLPINLDSRSGQAWRFVEKRGRITLRPSVWRDTGCHSHFVIWGSKIWLFGTTIEINSSDEQSLCELEPAVLALLRAHPGNYRTVDSLAEELEVSPWHIWSVCRALQRRRLLIMSATKDSFRTSGRPG